MKKFILLFILTAVLFCGGCAVDPPSFYFDKDTLISETVGIELIYCENDDPQILDLRKSPVPSFDYRKANVIGTLDTARAEEFLGALSTVTFHKSDKCANAPLGETLILRQNNGDMIVICGTVSGGVCYDTVSRFTSEGVFIEHIAKFADKPKFDGLLKDFFDKSED